MIRSLGRFRAPVWALAVAVVVAGVALRREPVDQPRNGSGGVSGNGPPAGRTAAVTGTPEPERYLGVVVAATRIELSSRLEGSVAAITVAVGEAVEAGRLLVRVGAESVRHELTSERASLAAAEAEERRARLRVEAAEHAHRRRSSLTDILSKEQIEESGFELESARLEVEAATARVRQVAARIEALQEEASRARILAPIDGVVGAVYVEPGEMVAPGSRIVRLIGSGGRIRFALPQERAGQLWEGALVRVRADELGHETTATVTGLAPEIDPESQMVFAEAKLEPGVRRGDAFPVGAVVRVATEAAGTPRAEGR